MTQETTFLVALGLTLAIALAVVIYLQQPLRKVLIELCGNDQRGEFWRAFASVMLLLTPITAELLAGPVEKPADAPYLAVGMILRWGLLGLVISLFCIAMGIAAFIRPGQTILAMDPGQSQELERLLRKVLAMRAREIVDQERPAA